MTKSVLFLAMMAALATFAQAQWRPSVWMNCTMLQVEKDQMDFSLDVRSDPIIAYKGIPNTQTMIYFYIYVNGQVITRDEWTVPPCNGDDNKCVKFYMISLERDISERIRQAPDRSTRISFNFKDTSAKVVFVRTKMCGEFQWREALGVWESTDRSYIDADVRVWAGGDERTVPQPKHLRRKYFHQEPHYVEDSLAAADANPLPSIRTQTVQGQQPSEPQLVSRSRRSHAPRRLFDSDELSEY